MRNSNITWQSQNLTFAANLDLASAGQRLWSALQLNDGHLPDLAQDGSGELVGSRLRVRYCREAADLFACEVLDVAAGLNWEAGLARTARGVAGFCRFADAAPSAWCDLVNAIPHEDAHPRHQPSFMSVAGAYFGGGGFALADNIAARAALEDDLAYWRDLARTQARVIEQLQREGTSRAFQKQGPLSDISSNAVDSPRAEESSRAGWLLRDIGAWAAMNSERIIILPRAIAACRKADFRDPQALYEALEILASDYSAAKRGNGPREAAKRKLQALGIEIGGSVQPSVAGEKGDEYFISWRGRRRFLDQHLRKGTSRDPRFSMRIYFTWDDELAVPIVGWMPSHLGNSRD